MDYSKVAKQVIDAVGKDNLVAAAHCATRLRLVLKDDSIINQKALDDNADVKGTFKTDGQYQVIIGPGDVNFVYAEIIKETGLKEVSTDDLKQIAASGKKFNPIMALIKLLSDIFVPIIPALVAGGLLMALGNFLTSKGLFGSQSLVQMYPAIKGLSDMIQLMSAAPFWFLPILVGISAAKRFGANQFLGASIGMIMVAPGAANIIGLTAKDLIGKASTIGAYTEFWDIFGMHVKQTSYIYQVIPVLAAVWILSYLEKFFHKKLPSAVDFTFTPLLSVMITGFLTFTVVGPVMLLVSNGITDAIVWLYNTTSFIGMSIFGGTYSLIVMTGLHQSFPAIETQLLSAWRNGSGHGDFIFVVASMANVAQGAATFAILFLTKNAKTKGLASSAGVSALLGITEPALFGVNLKYKFPFFCALIGSAVGALFAGLFQVVAVSLGSAGFLGFLSIDAKSIPFYFLCEVIAFAIAFALTYFYGKTKAADVFAAEATVEAAVETVEKEVAEEQVVENENSLQDETILAPVAGEVVALADVNDPVFSSGAMGQGLAIKPSEGVVYAPADAEVTIAFATGHAYGLKTSNGAEILIHVGIDTVSMNGEGFNHTVAQGDKVKAGDVLGTFDSAKIAAAGLEDTTMVIVTNTADYASVTPVGQGTVSKGDAVIEVKA
ncbi:MULTISPECIES: sucrose-specific PTS transporter subunit IIBC [Streptococcus]|jgi:PTS system sucrose-specific EIIBCA component|uniref:protein-N(pi)-phosphohistidine--sucrose phosphotransferase n=3 Tax=Bacillota TaxID=1239 RepID=A0AB35FSP0_STRGN|nr:MULTISPECIES: sucrose-specific PTS transporter subunit IIBC [Streptococcus]ALD71698.1 PTS sucrose transporter subunit IIA [Streptococcus gordonii]ARC46829.1 PTS beta-glucoside transporter subunit IIBCA [Streptococcus gordonii]ATF64755.1 PTS beta-glucoside transporter subunit EIIBCA [Streptococcus gordonii]MBS6244440.1 sucrose-specific PTS transporter subunit IIBC [Streptococcus sp.]MBW7663718.1 sucrose-specific PTS transporter subunit IIBC [Streptococcus gordonii]